MPYVEAYLILVNRPPRRNSLPARAHWRENRRAATPCLASREYGFRWMIAHHAVDIVQPDLHYHGGFIRSLRVARMAHAAGLLCTPHMSGSGLGYLDAVHFVSCIENPVLFTEFKGNADLPVSSPTSSLKCEHGTVRVPSGPGFGISVDAGFVRASKKVTTF